MSNILAAFFIRIRNELTRRFPELLTDEGLSGSDAVERLGEWLEDARADGSKSDIGHVVAARFPELVTDADLAGSEAVDRLSAWLVELDNSRGRAPAESLQRQCVTLARGLHESDEIHIDDDAQVSIGNGVARVQAWITLTGLNLPPDLQRDTE